MSSGTLSERGTVSRFLGPSGERGQATHVRASPGHRTTVHRGSGHGLSELHGILADSLQRVGRLRHMGGAGARRSGVHGHGVDVPALQRELGQAFECLATRLRERAYPEQDIQDMLYALVAHADEVALTGSDALRQGWLGALLQRHYFGENTAGENFFWRLDAVRRDPRRRPVLFVYYLCLLLGFQGAYRVHGQGGSHVAALQQLLTDLRRELSDALQPTAVLSPHGLRPKERVVASVSVWSVLRFPVAVAAVGVLVFLGFRFWLGHVSSSVIARMEAAQHEGEVLR